MVEEKRFVRIENENGISIKDTKTDYERYYAIEVLDDLNELADRITMLEEDLLAMNMTNGNLEKMLKYAKEENEQLKEWNKYLAEKRHNEKESNQSLIKKLISKIDFLERIIDGDV